MITQHANDIKPRIFEIKKVVVKQKKEPERNREKLKRSTTKIKKNFLFFMAANHYRSAIYVESVGGKSYVRSDGLVWNAFVLNTIFRGSLKVSVRSCGFCSSDCSFVSFRLRTAASAIASLSSGHHKTLHRSLPSPQPRSQTHREV